MLAALNAATLLQDRTLAPTQSMPTSGQYNLDDYSHNDANATTVREGFHPQGSYSRTLNPDGTYTTTGDLNLSNNSHMKEFFKYRSRQNNAMTVINALGNRNDQSRDRYEIDAKKLTNQYLYEQYPDSNETNYTKEMTLLREFAINHSVSGKTIKCYIKRELIPKYFCPLEGLNQTLYGGHPADESTEVKRTCDEVCVTPTLGCRGADTGESSIERRSGTATFAPGDTSEQPFVFNLNDKLKFRSLRYRLHVEKSANVNWAQYKAAPVTLPYRLEYTDRAGVDHVAVSRYSIFLDDNDSNVLVGALPDAKRVRLTFYPPEYDASGVYAGTQLGDYLASVTISDFEVRYASSEYYFCNIDQIVTDPATQCQNGKIYQMAGTNGSFKVCVQPRGVKGPEPLYNAFYSRERCEQACVHREECVATFRHYTFAQITSPQSYRISVGCSDTPGNGACSPQLCEQMIRSEQMPMQEAVYSPTRTAKYTVVGGAELPDVRRPKVDLDAERAAASSGDYEGVFTETMKDAAYDNMIKYSTFNYVEGTVGEPTKIEYAYEREVHPSASPYKPSKIAVRWLVKPSSIEYDGANYKFYVIARYEVIYQPISGLFLTDDSYNTTYDKDNFPYFKDVIFASLQPDGHFVPFYLDEYAYIQRGDPSRTDWEKNLQHRNPRYVRYDAAADALLTASGSAVLTPFRSEAFSKAVNYKSLSAVDDLFERFTTGRDGMMFVRQESEGSTVLPDKRWSGSREESAGSLGRVQLFGFYKKGGSLEARIPVEMDEKELDGKIFYDTARYKSLSDKIKGDGAMGASPVHIFLKGPASQMDASATLEPGPRDEGKDAVMFMFLYKKD